MWEWTLTRLGKNDGMCTKGGFMDYARAMRAGRILRKPTDNHPREGEDREKCDHDPALALMKLLIPTYRRT